jgi:hypothetical protein
MTIAPALTCTCNNKCLKLPSAAARLLVYKAWTALRHAYLHLFSRLEQPQRCYSRKGMILPLLHPRLAAGHLEDGLVQGRDTGSPSSCRPGHVQHLPHNT